MKKPVFVNPVVKLGNKICFYRNKRQYICGPDDAMETFEIFKHADGSKTVEEISTSTKIPLNKVSEILSELKKIEVVVDIEKLDKFLVRDISDVSGSNDEKAEIFTRLIGNYKNNSNSSDSQKPLAYVWLNDFHEGDSFFSAAAMYFDEYDQPQLASATSTSSLDALFKAAIEGYERWCSSRARVDYFGPKDQVKNWIEPYEIAPITYFQAKKNGLTYYRDDLSIDWTLGKTISGSDIYVPTDLIYYGHKNDRNRIFYGNSSGIAAYSNPKEAKKRALTELIERDALMRNWFKQKSPNILSRKCLPEIVRNRISYWKQQNRDLYVLELDSEYGNVFEAIFVSDEYPCFVSGAAATIESSGIVAAMKKAVDEAEFNLNIALRKPMAEKIKAKEVWSPTQHGEFYYWHQNAKKLKWLWSGKTVKNITSPEYETYEELAKKLKLITVDLSQKILPEISVVRIMTPDLLPISFGFYAQHFLHNRVGEWKTRATKLPHYFA